MAEDWTQEQQDEFTKLYGELENLPGYDRKKAYSLLFPPDKQLPYNEFKKRLTLLMEEFKGGGLEQKMESTTSAQKKGVSVPTRIDYLARLVATVAGVALFAGYLV